MRPKYYLVLRLSPGIRIRHTNSSSPEFSPATPSKTWGHHQSEQYFNYGKQHRVAHIVVCPGKVWKWWENILHLNHGKSFSPTITITSGNGQAGPSHIFASTCWKQFSKEQAVLGCGWKYFDFLKLFHIYYRLPLKSFPFNILCLP